MRGGTGGVVEYVRAALVIAAATLAAMAARALLHVPDVEMLYLLAVMAIAFTAGRRASLLGAALAVLSYDFFIVPPPYTLDVADARYLLTFAMMFGVSAVIGTLTVKLREERGAALARERRAAALYALSRDLAAARDERAIATVCARATAAAFEAAAVLLRPHGQALAPLAAAPEDAALDADERDLARWVLDHGRLAGAGTDIQGGASVLCAPILAWGEVAAVLAVRARGLDAEQRSLLEALARHAALALDRERLADEARSSALRVEAERLRSGLLSAVSHDFRTPLATITGAATTLRDEAGLDAATRADLAGAISDEAERLERLVSNLLEMTRLDSGAVEAKREWVPVEELVGGALTRMERALAGRPVVTAIAEGLPLVSVDPVLLEQLLLNLLENAIKYTPAGSEIAIRAERDGDAVSLVVADRGPGIPPRDEERVFERFQRGAHPGVRGAGLGLAVARAIAQVHGATLRVANRSGGGAEFRLTFPAQVAPEGAPPGAGAVP